MTEPTLFDLVMGAELVQLSLGDYAEVRRIYRGEIWAAIQDYFTQDHVRITRFRNLMKKAMVNAFLLAIEIGFADGGGGVWATDAEPEDKQWAAARTNAELGFIDSLFYQLKDLKIEGMEAWIGEADRRAEGYCKTLDSIYSEAKMRGARNIVLTFGGHDGAESCATCQKLKGQRHKASWWIKRNLIPGRPGNHSYICGGWQCQHFLFDDTGKVWTT